MLRVPMSIAAALGLAACAYTSEPLPSQTVDSGYASGGGTYNTGTRLTVRANTFQSAGKVAVCAAWAADGVTAPTMPYHDNVLEIGVVQLGGRNVWQGFDTFPRAADRVTLGIAPARCIRTGHDWRPTDEGQTPDIAFGQITLDRDDDGSKVLWFTGD